MLIEVKYSAVIKVKYSADLLAGMHAFSQQQHKGSTSSRPLCMHTWSCSISDCLCTIGSIPSVHLCFPKNLPGMQ